MATNVTTIRPRITSSRQQFAANAASGFVAQAVTVGVGFVLMPYLMWRLGPEAYGISRLAQSALVFFTLLQFGMGPTLVRYCSQAIAKHDHETIRKVSSAAQLILSTLGLLGMIGIVAAIPLFLKFYAIPAEMVFRVSGLLLCLAVSFFLNFLFIVPNGLILGSNRYDQANGIEITANLLRLGLIFLTFELLGPSILLLGICILSAQFFRFLAFFLLAILHTGRSALFSIRAVNKKTIKSLIGFSLLNLINSAAYSLVIQGPILIIGKVLGAEAVTMFAPAVLVASAMQGFLGKISMPLVPLASQAQAENKSQKMGEWSMIIGSFIATIGLAFTLPFFVFGNEIIGLWLGPDMVHIWIIVAIMALGTVMTKIVGANYFLSLGGGNIQCVVYSQVILGSIVTTGVAIGASFFEWQLLDIAIFIVVLQCFRNVFYLTYAYSRQFSYSPHRYILVVYAKPCAVFLLACAAGQVTKMAIPPDSSMFLCFGIILTLVIYGFLQWLLVVPMEIKSYLYCFFPLRRASQARH